MKCRACSQPLERQFLDLGAAPPSNAYLRPSDLGRPEVWLPLKLHTCDRCLLVQVDEIELPASLFSHDYAYFSSYSRTWLQHAERYVEEVVERLDLGADDLVIELASNDGYLLQYVLARGIRCLGIEPTESTAQVARERGIETIVEFFGKQLAEKLLEERGAADLIVGNNVLAHVPDLNDFVSGISTLLSINGVATMEFPHLLELVKHRQFDTIYHEHFSYFSLHTVQEILSRNGLRVWDVQTLGTHGGSLRIWACHQHASRLDQPAVAQLRAREASEGMLEPAWYEMFQEQAEFVKDAFVSFLLEQKNSGKLVAGYGAAAKGNTLLNFAGIRPDLIRFVADASPHKQGKFLPGSRIPIVSEDHLIQARPDFVVVFPWNLYAEISEQLSYIRTWGGKFVRAVPGLQVS